MVDTRDRDIVAILSFLHLVEGRVFIFLSFIEGLFGFDCVLCDGQQHIFNRIQVVYRKSVSDSELTAYACDSDFSVYERSFMICLRLASSILASFKISFSTFLRRLGEVEVMDLELGVVFGTKLWYV